MLVGIALDRSIEMAVGLLGILKAGGVYLPLSIDYPKQRLALMLEDAAKANEITRRDLVQSGGVPEPAGSGTVLITRQELIGHLPETAATAI